MGILKRVFYNGDLTIFKEVSTINIHRIYMMGFIMGVINIAHVVFFLINIPDGPKNVVQWHQLIIFIHALMLVINGLLALIAFRIEKRGKLGNGVAIFVQCFSILLNLLFGILLCVSDQLVTSNINPLLIACIGVGVIFLIPPILGLAFYIVTFVLFFNTVPMTQHIPDLLELVRINSVTATGMGFGASWILWKNHLLRVKQQKIIEDQKRELEEKNEYLQFVAIHDPLTGLFDRIYFSETVNTEIKRNRRMFGEACIVLLGLDSFKKINDNFGHPAGDKVIKETAAIIRNTLRGSDIPARLGGEEFIILLPGTGLQAGREVAEKLRRMIQENTITFEGHTIKVTASFGVSKLIDSFEVCYSQADKALYAAKEKGKNCVVVFNDALVVNKP